MSVWSTYQPPTSCKISKKSNEAILRKLIKYGKSVHFRPFWSIFGTMRIFLKHPALSLFSIYQYSTSCQISKKSNKAILRKLQSKKMDGRTDGQTDGQAWNHRTLAKRGSNNSHLWDSCYRITMADTKLRFWGWGISHTDRDVQIA